MADDPTRIMESILRPPSREALTLTSRLLAEVDVPPTQDTLLRVARVLEEESGLGKAIEALNAAAATLLRQVPSHPLLSMTLEGGEGVDLRLGRRVSKREADEILSAVAGAVVAMTAEVDRG